MTSARDNINARLGGDGDQESHDRSDAPRPKMTKANAPSNQNYDAERYNADGTLRTCHNLPSDDDRWKEARKAHYIRKNEPPGSDKLNIDDIFAKD